MYPIWQVKFSSQGYYFVSCGHDKTVRLWTTEQWQCVRIFVGHFSDVDCVAFHPNSNYVASGSWKLSTMLGILLILEATQLGLSSEQERCLISFEH